MVVVDAIVLAGGRSSRLGGVPKQTLVLDGTTLLAHALDAVSFARHVVVVGEAVDALGADAAVKVVREDPPLAGPAAAVAAGLDALPAADTTDWVCVIACDMPRVGVAVEYLRAAVRDGDDSDCVSAVDASGRVQPLVALYRRSALEEAARSAASAARGVVGLSMMKLIEGLRVEQVPVPAGSTDDIDTWNDAESFGISKDGVMSDDTKMNTLEEWAGRLADELGQDGFAFDIDAVLDLAGEAAHAVLRPAAPLTTFLVGYAAGRAVASGEARSSAAIQDAIGRASALCRETEAEVTAAAVRPSGHAPMTPQD